MLILRLILSLMDQKLIFPFFAYFLSLSFFFPTSSQLIELPPIAHQQPNMAITYPQQNPLMFAYNFNIASIQENPTTSSHNTPEVATAHSAPCFTISVLIYFIELSQTPTIYNYQQQKSVDIPCLGSTIIGIYQTHHHQYKSTKTL